MKRAWARRYEERATDPESDLKHRMSSRHSSVVTCGGATIHDVEAEVHEEKVHAGKEKERDVEAQR